MKSFLDLMKSKDVVSLWTKPAPLSQDGKDLVARFFGSGEDFVRVELCGYVSCTLSLAAAHEMYSALELENDLEIYSGVRQYL